MGLDDLLKILEQASASQSTGSSADADPLTDLLGSLLGGGTQATPTRSSKSSGSRRTSSAKNASSNDALSGMLAPIANELANKLGLPPELANAVIAFAVTQLANSQANASGSSSRQNTGSVLAKGRGMLSNADGGLVQRLGSGQAIDSDFLHSSGIAQQLASQTGMDSQTAATSLQQVFSMLSGNAPAPSAPATSIFGKASASVGVAESESPVSRKKSSSKSHKK
jgi:hypothetical protein